MPRFRRPGGSGRRTQRGSIAIVAAFAIAALIAALGVIDVGHLFWTHRQMQSAADLAALSAVQEVGADSTCTAAHAVAAAVANPASDPDVALAVACGVWHAPTAAGASATFTSATGEGCNALAAGNPASGAAVNAVCVTVSEPVRDFFGSGTRNVSASAIARASAADTFSIDTTLAALSGGVANDLIGSLVDCPQPSGCISLQAIDYQGLANVNLNMADIVASLPVGSTTAVLSSSVTVGELAQAELDAADKEQLANADLNLLHAIVAAVGETGGPTVQLSDLFSAAAANGSSALNAGVNAFGLISTALRVANGSHAIAIGSAASPLSVQTPGALSGLINVSVSGSAAVAGNPPVIASGPPGPPGCGTLDCITHTATQQGTVFVNVGLSLMSTCANGSSIFTGGACGDGSTPKPGVAVNLPVTAYLAPATAGLAAAACSTSDGQVRKTATVDVQPGVLAVYIGGSSGQPAAIDLDAADSGGAASFAPSPAAMQTPLLTVSLTNLLHAVPALGSTLGSLLNGVSSGLTDDISVTVGVNAGQISIPAASQQASALQFTSVTDANGEIVSATPPSPAYTLSAGTDQFLSPAVQSALQSGLYVSVGLFSPVNCGLLGLNCALNGGINGLLGSLGAPLLAALAPIVTPLVLAPVDSVLAAAAGTLGLTLGQVNVANMPSAIKCGSPALVQ